MPEQVTNYQCPACTGPLHFSSATGKLECDYCGSSYEVSEIEALYAQKDQQAAQAMQQAQTAGGEWDTSGLQEDWGADGANMKSYTCPSCGAELLCDAATAATSCPYCGNPTVVPGQFAGMLKPDYVIPFQKSKEDAVAALKTHYRGKPLLPSAFTRENHIQEIQGVYVPFWMFDGEAEGRAEYQTTKSQTYTSGDYEVKDTDHFLVSRAGTMAFEKVPVDASSRMPDDHMDSIEPYDYGALKPFSMAYLPGFLADKYDVSVDDSRKRADQRIETSFRSALEETVRGYDTRNRTSEQIHLKRGRVHYALLPVWMLSTRWNGKTYLFAMNGQTGKMVGDLPASKGKLAAFFAGIAVPLIAIGTAVAFALVR